MISVKSTREEETMSLPTAARTPIALLPWIVAALALPVAVHAGTTDSPELASWKLNTTGLTGYNGLPADVQNVRYSSSSVYVNCSSIPEYGIGPWPGNPNTPVHKA